MSNYTPKTRLEKILCGVEIAARNGLEKAVKAAMERIESALELPTVTNTDNGKVLKVVAGKWQKAADSGDTLPVVSAADNGSVLGVVAGAWAKDSPVYAATGTLTKNESNKDVFTLTKTASELYEAVVAGKRLKITTTFVENETETTVETILSSSAVKMTAGGSVGYEFYIVNNEGEALKTTTLGGTDTVVFTEV